MKLLLTLLTVLIVFTLISCNRMTDLANPENSFEGEFLPIGKAIAKNDSTNKKRSSFLVDDDQIRDNNPIDFQIKETKAPVVYEIKHTTKIIAREHTLLDAEVQMEWRLNAITQKDNSFIYDIDVIKNETIKSAAFFNELMAFTKKMYTAYNHIVLKLEPNGNLNGVVNMAEINEKWNHIKKFELAEFFSSEANKVVEEKMKIDFQNPLPSLQLNWLYILFFTPSYSNKKQLNKLVTNRKIAINSTMMPEVKLTIETNEKVIKANEQELKLEQNLSFMKGGPEKEKYLQQFGQLLGGTFKHQFTYYALYTFDVKTSLLKECEAIITERLDENSYHETRYTIKQKMI